MTNHKNPPISQLIDGMRRAGAGSNPMVFDDYRRPMRAAMLRDARAAMLAAAGCPDHIAVGLARRPLSEWPQQARDQIGEYNERADS